MKFRENSQEENCITPNISGLREKFEKRMHMAKKTVNLLPGTKRILEKVGTNIKRARLRRNIRLELLAESTGISVDTLSAIEKGRSTVSIGAYMAVLVVLGLGNDVELIALDEEGKRQYQEQTLHRRKRAVRKKGEKKEDE